METEASQSNRREGIKQYGMGYGVVFVLTFVFVYLVMPDEERNTGEVLGYVWGGGIFILFLPCLLAWLGKTDTPLRRFVLFLAVWVILVGMILIGIYVA